MHVDNSIFWDTHGREICVVTGLTAEVKDCIFVLHCLLVSGHIDQSPPFEDSA